MFSSILEQKVLMFTVNIALKFFSSGSYVIIYIYANETFPTQGRNTGMGVCSMIARLGAIIGTFSNDHLVNVLLLVDCLDACLFRRELGFISRLFSTV